jgi:ketosteroid isomerase-like protein
MDELSRLIAEQACAALITRYTHLVDEGQASGVADLFTADGVWASPESTFDGQDAIRTAFLRREQSGRRSRHVCTNVTVDVEDEAHATGLCYLTLYRTDAEGTPARGTTPDLIGVYRDRFTRTEDGWRFASRRTEVTFVRG